MDSLEMLRKIKNKDADAFNELMNTYGMRVYSRLLRQLGDKALADEAFKKTMLEFFDAVSSYEGDDIVEAMLYKRADEVQSTMVDGSLKDLIREVKAEMGDANAQTKEAEHCSVVTVRPAQRAVSVQSEAAKEAFEEISEDVSIGKETAIAAIEAEMAAEAEAPAEQKIAAPVQETMPAEPEKVPEVKKKKAHPLLVLLLIVLLVVIVWMGAGVMMSYNIIPQYDAGYAWFNTNVYPLFTLVR